ncbi:nuclear transport factor 2 family protein [Variovorax sp. LT1R16]|uniref:nuclear transport factor 2 family protein n=1 Tax=Variovorax sp. LT1R16 TaxID=3443728 RepID=UPI003F47E81D
MSAEAPGPADLQSLLDREAIRDCLYRYCRGIDRVDEAALRSAYWEDATDCHGAWNGSAAGFIAQALPKLRQGGRRIHQITNVLIELHGDAAAVESSFFALQATAAQPERETFLCGRYLDRFERRCGVWRVAARIVVYDWIEERVRPELTQDDAALFGPRQPVGGPAPHDALYALLRQVRAA